MGPYGPIWAHGAHEGPWVLAHMGPYGPYRAHVPDWYYKGLSVSGFAIEISFGPFCVGRAGGVGGPCKYTQKCEDLAAQL